MPGRKRILLARVHFPPVALYSLQDHRLAPKYVNVPIHGERTGVVDKEFGSGRVLGLETGLVAARPFGGAANPHPFLRGSLACTPRRRDSAESRGPVPRRAKGFRREANSGRN